MNKLGQAAAASWPAIAWTVGPSSAVAGLAMHAAGQYGDVVALGALGTAGTAGVLALASLSKKWSETFSWASGVLSLATLHAGVSALSGWDWPTLYSWVISSGLSFAAYLAYRHHTRNDIHHLDKRIKLSKAETAFARARMAELQLADKLTAPTAVVAPEPSTVLTGTVLESPEERALREAFHAVWKSPLESVRAQRTGYGYEAVLVVPATPGRDRVLREWSKIEGGVSVEGEFYPTKGTLSNEVLVRYVEGDPLAESIEYEPTPGRTHKDPIRLGRGMFGDALEVDMNQNHTLVAGTSKYGKSNIMKLIAFRLAEAGAVLYGVDMKPNAIEFTPLKPILQDLAQTPSQTRVLFVWLTKEMHERGAIINHSDIKEWDPAVHGRPVIYVLIDEHKILISLGDAEAKQTGEVKISKLVEDLLAQARGFGIHLVIAAQQPDKDVWGGKTSAKGNITNAISVRMGSGNHIGHVFTSRAFDPTTLTKAGEFLIQSPEHPRPVKYRAEYIKAEVVRAEVARLAKNVVRGGIGERLILPAPHELNNQEHIVYLLENYGEMSRVELEQGTGLDKDAVLRTTNRMVDRVQRHGGVGSAPGTYSLRQEGYAGLRVVGED